MAAYSLGCNINFAERLNLISTEKANDFRFRLKKAINEYDSFIREYNNKLYAQSLHSEKDHHYMNMNDIKSEIKDEKLKDSANAKRNEHIAHTSHEHVSDEFAEFERSK